MPQFKYAGKSTQGGPQKGVIEAASAKAAAQEQHEQAEDDRQPFLKLVCFGHGWRRSRRSSSPKGFYQLTCPLCPPHRQLVQLGGVVVDVEQRRADALLHAERPERL